MDKAITRTIAMEDTISGEEAPAQPLRDGKKRRSRTPEFQNAD
jgi:hypothetical protein